VIDTGIGWCDDTFNLWWGCTEHGPGCLHCYAREWAKRCGLDIWGPKKPRRIFGEKHWKQLDEAQALAIASGESRRVFVGSMMDLAEDRDELVPIARDFFHRVRARYHALDFLCLTKRPERYPLILSADWGNGYENVWLIASAVTQEEVSRNVAALEAVPARVRGLSIEPQLEAVRVRSKAIHWRITGGESGGRDKARFYDPEWSRLVIADAEADGAAAFVKQFGTLWAYGNRVLSKKADVPAEWPVDLRVQNHPLPRRRLARAV